MSRTKLDKPKRNVWTDPSPYGTYQGEPGNDEQWKKAFEFMKMTRDQALGIMGDDDPYKFLGVEKNDTANFIKMRWYKLVLENHPDKGGDRIKFEKIMAAYNLIKK